MTAGGAHGLLRVRRHASLCCLALGLGAALIGGCAGGGVRHNEDGTVSIDCSGGHYDWSRCHERAVAVCGDGGFEIHSRVSDEGSSGVGSQDWSTEGSEVRRTMVVRCRE